MILLARPAWRRAGGLSATASLGSTDKPTPPTFPTTCCTPNAQHLTSPLEAYFGSLLRPTDAASLILRLPSDHGADDGRTRLWALWLLVKYVSACRAGNRVDAKILAPCNRVDAKILVSNSGVGGMALYARVCRRVATPDAGE